MKILDIRTRRKSLYALVLSEKPDFDGAKLDENGYLLVDRTAFDESGYAVGNDIPDSETEKLIFTSAYYRARERALYYLSNRDYAEKEMAQKLRREFGEEAASAAAKRMVELCLIDDEGFADRYAEIMLNVKGWSPSRAIRELVLKGVDRDYAEQAVASVGVSPKDLIRDIIDKKYARLVCSGDPKSVTKAVNALARKGYSFSDIRSVIADYCDTDEMYD